MIIEHIGNLLSVEEGIIVHGCNCHGVMGSGVAAAIRDKYPTAYAVYKNRYNEEGLKLGDIISISGIGFGYGLRGVNYIHPEMPSKLVVVNAMTQYDMASGPDDVVVDYDAITASFARIKILARDVGLAVHFPLIGCGLANGDWKEVAPRIEAALGPNIEAHLWVLP